MEDTLNYIADIMTFYVVIWTCERLYSHAKELISWFGGGVK